MQITMDKKYTYRNGQSARILCLDRNYKHLNIVSMGLDGIITVHEQNGRGVERQWDLIEVWQPQDKEPVWAWDYPDTVSKRLSFYDNINKKLFTYDGKRSGQVYTNYAKVEHVEQWMLDAQAKLQD